MMIGRNILLKKVTLCIEVIESVYSPHGRRDEESQPPPPPPKKVSALLPTYLREQRNGRMIKLFFVVVIMDMRASNTITAKDAPRWLLSPPIICFPARRLHHFQYSHI